jgi:uridine phosphorylase
MPDYPILEFDPDRDALISPSTTTGRALGEGPVPRIAVACFFQEGIEAQCVRAGARIVATLSAEHGGTSYHYQPPSREIAGDPATIKTVEKVLEDLGVPFVAGKTWTTDAPYRETRGKIAQRSEEGCLTVEMEAAAFLAVAAFRGVRFASLPAGRT